MLSRCGRCIAETMLKLLFSSVVFVGTRSLGELLFELRNQSARQVLVEMRCFEWASK